MLKGRADIWFSMVDLWLREKSRKYECSGLEVIKLIKMNRFDLKMNINRLNISRKLNRTQLDLVICTV